MSDANWFFSACAQTAGAIVAIVGGFLVSRLVSSDSERRGAKRSLELAKLNLERAVSRKEEAEAELRVWEAEDFHSGALSMIVDSDIEWEQDAIVHSYEGDLLSERDLLEIIGGIETTAKVATEAFSQIDIYSISNMEFEEAPGVLTDTSEITKNVYRAAFRQCRQQARDKIRSQEIIKAPHLGWLNLHASTDFGEHISERNTYLALRKRFIEAKTQTDQGEAAIEALEREAIELPRARGLFIAWLTLVYLSVVGVAIPLALLPAGVTASAWKLPVLILFLIGLAFLLGYFLVVGAFPRRK